MRIGEEGGPERLQKAYAATEGDPAWTESRALIAQGKPPGEMFQALAVRPDILQSISGFGASVYPGGLLERALKERVIVAVSRRNECQYCTGSHTDTMRRLGICEDSALLSEREWLALEYARAAVKDSNCIPDTLFERLRAAFSDEEIVELTMLIGLTGMLNLFNNCLQVEYRGDYARFVPAEGRDTTEKTTGKG